MRLLCTLGILTFWRLSKLAATLIPQARGSEYSHVSRLGAQHEFVAKHGAYTASRFGVSLPEVFRQFMKYSQRTKGINSCLPSRDHCLLNRKADRSGFENEHCHMRSASHSD